MFPKGSAWNQAAKKQAEQASDEEPLPTDSDDTSKRASLSRLDNILADTAQHLEDLNLAVGSPVVVASADDRYALLQEIAEAREIIGKLL